MLHCFVLVLATLEDAVIRRIEVTFYVGHNLTVLKIRTGSNPSCSLKQTFASRIGNNIIFALNTKM